MKKSEHKNIINEHEESYPLVLTVKDISQILKISKPTAYEVMNQKDFPLLRIGRCKRVIRYEFFSWLRNRV
jgi:predicted DNA-binding transcriptional regulator AlpA